MKTTKRLFASLTVLAIAAIGFANPASATSTGQRGMETICGYDWQYTPDGNYAGADIVVYQGPTRVYVDRPQWVRVRIDVQQPMFYGGTGPYLKSAWTGWKYSRPNYPASFSNRRFVFHPDLGQTFVYLDVQVNSTSGPIKVWKTSVFNHVNRWGDVTDDWNNNGLCNSPP